MWQNHETPISKEIIENLNKWRDTLVHGQKGSILLRCQFYPICSTDSTKSQAKSQQEFFSKIQELILIFMCVKAKESEQPK